MDKTLRKLLRVVANHDPDYYDMYQDANEALFARRYVERIMQEADALGIRPPGSLLEAGCQAGRLVIPFAKLGFRVTGIDTSGFALRRAQKHLDAAGAQATLVRGDLVKVIDRHPDWQFDVVVCAEVVYLSPEYRAMVERLARAVRPGGLLCVSHRPRFYYLLEMLRAGDLARAEFVLRHGEGSLEPGGKGYYNWQSPDELETLYRSMGMQWRGVFPVDRYAWLSGVNPSTLSEPEREQLLAIEQSESPYTSACARYVCAMSQRPNAGSTG